MQAYCFRFYFLLVTVIILQKMVHFSMWTGPSGRLLDSDLACYFKTGYRYKLYYS